VAESRLKVILETSGTGAVKAARRGVDQLKNAVQALDKSLAKTIPLQDRVARGFTKLKAGALGAARGIKKAAQSLSSLQGVLGGLAIGAIFKGAIDQASEYEAAILRISRLEGQFKNLAGLQDQASESARTLFVSQTQAAKGYANLASRIGTSVGSVKELQAVYEGLEIVLLKNAKSTQEAASLQLQLNQALGKGTLNGDEFRTIAENAPEILRQLAKDAGVAESAIKDLSSKGFVTTEKLIKALANLRNSGIEDFNALLETNLGKIRKYDTAIEDLELTIGRDLLPAFTPLIEALTFIAKAFAALPEPVRKVILALTAVVAVVSLIAPLIAGLSLAVVVLGTKFIAAAALVGAI
jgi:tape measure domain-containing protein